MKRFLKLKMTKKIDILAKLTHNKYMAWVNDSWKNVKCFSC